MSTLLVMKLFKENIIDIKVFTSVNIQFNDLKSNNIEKWEFYCDKHNIW